MEGIDMKSNVPLKKILYIVLLLFVCLFFNRSGFTPENPAINHILLNDASLQVEKQYMHPHETGILSDALSTAPTLEPTAMPTPELTATPTPELTATPAPTATRAPVPASTPIPTPEPVPILTDRMISSMTPGQIECSDLAYKILNNPKITLARIHPSGVRDNAFAYNNIVDTYNGNAAQRSRYQNAPGGSVFLDAKMLRVILLLAEKYTFTITEIAGASHSKSSNHYDGVAFDVGTINGRYASNNALSRSFTSDAKNIGATSTVVESTCVHIDFK